MSKKAACLIILLIIGAWVVLSLPLLNIEIEFQIPYVNQYLPDNWIWVVVMGGLVLFIFFSRGLYKYLTGQRRKFSYEKKIKKSPLNVELLGLLIFISLFGFGSVLGFYFGRFGGDSLLLGYVIPGLLFAALAYWSNLKFLKHLSVGWLLLRIFSIVGCFGFFTFGSLKLIFSIFKLE